jgi:hypothetical protein
MIYMVFKMPDVAARSGSKSSESSRKQPTFHGAPQWKSITWTGLGPKLWKIIT